MTRKIFLAIFVCLSVHLAVMPKFRQNAIKELFDNSLNRFQNFNFSTLHLYQMQAIDLAFLLVNDKL